MTTHFISSRTLSTSPGAVHQSEELEIFISHAWDWNEHYSQMLGWLSSSRSFTWRNCSFPCHGGMDDVSVESLKKAITRQIESANLVLVLGGMLRKNEQQLAGQGKWIEYEIQEARRLNKTMIGVKPWDGSATPTAVRAASICEPLDWDRNSIVEEVKRRALKASQRQLERIVA